MATDTEPCGYECMCDSLADHERQIEDSRLDFLRNPGPPPRDWSPERVARAQRGIDEARRKEGL